MNFLFRKLSLVHPQKCHRVLEINLSCLAAAVARISGLLCITRLLFCFRFFHFRSKFPHLKEMSGVEWTSILHQKYSDYLISCILLFIIDRKCVTLCTLLARARFPPSVKKSGLFWQIVASGLKVQSLSLLAKFINWHTTQSWGLCNLCVWLNTVHRIY